MTRIVFKRNGTGIKALLRSPGAQQAVNAAAAGMAARAGEGFGTHSTNITRARAYVRAETPAARRRQAQDHVLERVYGGGG